MGNTKFLVRYSQLNPQVLKEEILKRYALGDKIDCRFFDSGLNDIYKVKTPEQIYYLRVSLANRHTQTDYEEETTIISSLGENGVSVAMPVPCKYGNFVWGLDAPEGRRYVVLFLEAKNIPDKDGVKKAYQLGKMTAKLHTIADKKDFEVSREPIDYNQLVKGPLENIKPYLEHRVDDYIFLCSKAEMLWQYIKEHLNSEKPYFGYCHGDIHDGNVFFERDMPKLFDFDCMGYGYRAYDICVYAWNRTFNDESFTEGEEWKSYLEGYNLVRKLSPEELDSINAFAALRQLWLMGLHADVMKRNAGCSWYNEGYFDYNIRIFKLWVSKSNV